MTLLIANNSELVDYLPISEGGFDFDRIKPFLLQAQRKYIVPAISQAEFDVLDKSTAKKEVYEILAHATAHFAMHLGFVQLSTFISNAGMLQPDPKGEAKNINWADRKDLQRHYIRSGFDGIDQALTLMEADKTTFDKWAASDAFTVFDETFCSSTKDFDRFQNINGSAQTFLRLRPFMREVWQQYFAQWLTDKQIAAIKASKILLPLAQQGEASYTVMKAIQQDGFIENHSGLSAVVELLPWEKLVVPSGLEIKRKVDAKREQGDNAIERLHELLLADTTIDYKANTYDQTERIKKYGSGLAL